MEKSDIVKRVLEECGDRCFHGKPGDPKVGSCFWLCVREALKEYGISTEEFLRYWVYVIEDERRRRIYD